MYRAKENLKFKAVLLDKDNNEIPDSEFIGWHSRSMAVTVVVCNPQGTKFLVEKRGPGCPDFIGKYCFPCGYLGWDETLRNAAWRELYEETGLKIQSHELQFLGINDNPNSNRQNVTVRFKLELTDEQMEDAVKAFTSDSEARGGEAAEVECLRIINIEDVIAHQEDFAFNHADLAMHVHDHPKP